MDSKSQYCTNVLFLSSPKKVIFLTCKDAFCSKLYGTFFLRNEKKNNSKKLQRNYILQNITSPKVLLPLDREPQNWRGSNISHYMRLVAVLTWLPLVSHSLLTQAIIIDQVRDFDLKWFNVLVVIHPFSTFPIFLVLNHQLKNLLSSLNLSTVDLLMTQCFWWLCPAILWYVVEQYLAMVFLFLKALILIYRETEFVPHPWR